MTRVSVQIDGEAKALFVGYTRGFGLKNHKPEPFLFWAPEGKSRGHYLQALAIAHELVDREFKSCKLCLIKPVEFDPTMFSKVDWSELLHQPKGAEPLLLHIPVEIMKKALAEKKGGK